MLAAVPDENRWAVLVDSDTYGITDADVALEESARPLPNRLRFTVAHELAHSLAFRPSDFGIRLRNSINTEDAKKAVVEAVERATDRLAPLLLLSERALIDFLKLREQPPTVGDFAEFRLRVGVSREALINRLRALSHTDANGTRGLNALGNIAICIGEWVDDRVAALRSWPVFFSFDRNIIPAFLMNLSHQDRLPARAAFADKSFALCGGDSPEIEVTVPAGTASVPDAEQMRVACSAESITRIPRSKFLLVVRKSL